MSNRCFWIRPVLSLCDIVWVSVVSIECLMLKYLIVFDLLVSFQALHLWGMLIKYGTESASNNCAYEKPSGDNSELKYDQDRCVLSGFECLYDI